MNGKKMKKHVILCILVEFIVLISVYVLTLTLSCIGTSARLKTNAEQAYDILEREGDYPVIYDDEAIRIDNFTDRIIVEKTTLNDIDRKAVDYFLRKAVDAQRLPEESINETTENVLKNLYVIDSEGKLKKAAILLFGKCPQDFITGVEFKIGFFGSDETDLIFQDLIEGNILQMCDTVIKTLKAKYLISPIHYEGCSV